VSNPTRLIGLLAALLTLLVLAPVADAEFSSTPAPGLVTDGPVEALASSGDNIYLGGSFETVGPRTGVGVQFTPSLSERSTAIPQVSGSGAVITTVISDGAGGWFIGGRFSSVGGVPRTNLAHILANDTVDPHFNPEPHSNQPTAYIQSLVLSGSTLYVAGEFEEIGDQKRSELAGIDTATGLATAFAPEPNGELSCGLTTYEGYVFACGRFQEIGGQKRQFLAELEPGSGDPTSWNPEPSSVPEVSYISPTGVLYLAFYGQFGIESPPRVEHRGIAALQLASEPVQQPTVLSLNPSFGTPGFFYEPPVTSFVQIGTTLYVGGRFNVTEQYEPEYSEEGHLRVMAFNTAENFAVLPFEAAPNNEVTGLAASEGHLYLTGTFSEVDHEPRQGLAEVNPTTAALEGENPKIDGRVDSLAATPTGVYAGGSITTVGGSHRNHLAIIDSATGELEEADPGVDGSVQSLAVDGSTLYVGGGFRNAISSGSGEEWKSRYNLAAFSTSEGKLTSFAPEPNGPVSALAIAGETLYAGGSFNQLHEVSHGPLAAFSTSDGTQESFNPEPNGSVSALTVSSGRLYVGGSFSQLSGESGAPSRNDVAAFDLPGQTLDSSFLPPTLDGSVAALAADESSLYIGGDFNEVGGTYQPRLAALSTTDGSRQEWNPQVSDDVDALALEGTTLYAGGNFNDAGGAIREGVAGLSTSTGTATTFDPEPDFNVSALMLSSSGLYMGGNFNSVGPVDQSYFASFTPVTVTEAEREREEKEERARHEREEKESHGGGSRGGGGGSSSEGSDAGSGSLASSPATFITAGPPYFTTAHTVSFSFSSDTPGVSFRCSIDGGTPFACSSPYTTPSLAAGGHHFVVQAVEGSTIDTAGASASFVVVDSANAAASDPPPVLSAVRVSAKLIRGLKHHPAYGFSFTLSKAASVTISLERVERVACGHHQKCTRKVPAGVMTMSEPAGTDHVSFDGNIQGRALLAGSYVAGLIADDPAALSSAPASVSFKIVAAHRAKAHPRTKRRRRG
jgi:trimeric autotransporter adhesin